MPTLRQYCFFHDLVGDNQVSDRAQSIFLTSSPSTSHNCISDIVKFVKLQIMYIDKAEENQVKEILRGCWDAGGEDRTVHIIDRPKPGREKIEWLLTGKRICDN